MNGWKIGIASHDITPEIGEFCSIRMVPGKRSTGILDRLSANAVYFEKDEGRLLYLSVDAVQIPADVVAMIKNPLIERYGLATEQIVIQATHAHHAPDIVGEEYVDNSAQVSRLVGGCLSVATAGLENPEPGRLGWGYTHAASPTNRFQWRTGGRAIKRVDRRVDILRITDPSGAHRCLIWHFAAHPTTALRDGYETSRDYYGEVNDILEHDLGGTAVFSQGACANINLVVDKRTREKTHHHARHIAGKILDVAGDIECTGDGDIVCAMTTVESPIASRIDEIERDPDPDEVKSFFGTLSQRHIDYSRDEEEFRLLQRMRRRAQRLALLEEFPDRGRYSETVEIQTFKLGDRLGVTIPGEPFVELQIELQSRYPKHRVMVLGYANGHIGYIPDEESFETASYETIPSYMKRAGRESGKRIVEAGADLLESILDI